MPNRNLTKEELAKAWELIASVKARLAELAGDDGELLFAYRRKVYKELIYCERGRPMVRRALKLKKMREQKGLCAECARPLPERYAVLDRTIAKDGYTLSTGIQKSSARSSKSPQVALGSGHYSVGLTSPAFSFSFNRYDWPRILTVIA